MRRKTAVLLIPLLLAVLNLGYLYSQIFNPRDTSTPESLLVYDAQRVMLGQSPYQDLQHPPYNYLAYTPLYVWVVGTVSGILHLSLSGIFVLGRAISLASCLGIALLLYFHGRRESPGFLLACSGAFFFLGSAILWQWGSTTRPDLLAIFFSLAGWTVYTRFSERPHRRFAILFFLLAFFTKQSTISGVPAVAAVEWLKNRRRESVLFFVVFLAAAALILYAMHRVSGGLSTWNMFEMNQGHLSLLNIKLIAVAFLQTAALSLFFAFLGVSDASKSQQNTPATVYFLLSLILSALSSAKLGSNVNYYLEPLAIGCLLVPAGISLLLRIEKGGFILALLLVILEIPQLNSVLYLMTNPDRSPEANIRQVVQSSTGAVLTDNPRLALISRKQFMIDPFPFSDLEAQGIWDSTELVAMLDKHEIELVVLSLPIENPMSWQGTKRLPQSAIKAIQRNYALQQIVDNRYVYAPRR